MEKENMIKLSVFVVKGLLKVVCLGCGQVLVCWGGEGVYECVMCKGSIKVEKIFEYGAEVGWEIEVLEEVKNAID